jgi:hypothetical protein
MRVSLVPQETIRRGSTRRIRRTIRRRMNKECA